MTTINLKDFYSWYVTDEYIAPMVNSMEKMDTIQQRLEAMHQSLQAARQLRNEYTRYNQYLLGKKGKYYLVARLFTQEQQAAVQKLEDQVALAQRSLEEARTGHQDAEQEYTARPTSADLAMAMDLAARQRDDVERKERAREDCAQQVRRQKEQLASLRAEILPLTQGLSYEPSADAYGEMAILCDEYREQYQTLFAEKSSLELRQSRVLDLEQQLDSLQEDLLACTDRIRRQQAEQRKVRAELAELEAYLARPETRALSQKMRNICAKSLRKSFAADPANRGGRTAPCGRLLNPPGITFAKMTEIWVRMT